MAINVKKLKRVIQGGEPLKVLNSGVKKPAFRQNGYGLTFDSANSDYLRLNKSVLINDIISIKCVLDVSSVSVSIYIISNQSNSLRLLTNSNTGTLIANGLNINDLLINNQSYPINTDLRLYDGQVIEVILSVTIDTSITTLFVRDGGNTTTDAKLLNFSISTESFNLPESRGTTTTGSNGTTATINTSHASGVQYLDSKVWNKKSFALVFDSANSEYIKTNFAETTVPIDDIDLEVSFRDLVYKGSGVQQIFNTNFAPLVNQNYLYIRVQTATTIRVSIGATAINLTLDLLDTNTVKINGKDLYLNNVFVQTLNTAATFMTFYGSTSVGASDIGLENLDGSILSLRLQGETFNLTEGLGNEVFGSNGTIGTINTSHASGVDRINYDMWLKGDDTNGWSPYV